MKLKAIEELICTLSKGRTGYGVVPDNYAQAASIELLKSLYKLRLRVALEEGYHNHPAIIEVLDEVM